MTQPSACFKIRWTLPTATPLLWSWCAGLLIGLALQVLPWNVLGRSSRGIPLRMVLCALTWRAPSCGFVLSPNTTFKDSQWHISATLSGLFLYLRCIAHCSCTFKHNTNNLQDKLKKQRWRLMQYSLLKLVDHHSISILTWFIKCNLVLSAVGACCLLGTLILLYLFLLAILNKNQLFVKIGAMYSSLKRVIL